MTANLGNQYVRVVYTWLKHSFFPTKTKLYKVFQASEVAGAYISVVSV